MGAFLVIAAAAAGVFGVTRVAGLVADAGNLRFGFGNVKLRLKKDIFAGVARINVPLIIRNGGKNKFEVSILDLEFGLGSKVFATIQKYDAKVTIVSRGVTTVNLPVRMGVVKLAIVFGPEIFRLVTLAMQGGSINDLVAQVGTKKITMKGFVVANERRIPIDESFDLGLDV